jgi:6-phosphofructokinase
VGARLGVAAVDALVQSTYGVYLTLHSGEISQEPYASVSRQQCKVQDEVLDLIARLQ